MKTVARMLAKDGTELCRAEVDGGTLRSAMVAVVGRLLYEADQAADLGWEIIEVKVNRWEV